MVLKQIGHSRMSGAAGQPRANALDRLSVPGDVLTMHVPGSEDAAPSEKEPRAGVTCDAGWMSIKPSSSPCRHPSEMVQARGCTSVPPKIRASDSEQKEAMDIDP